MEFYIAAVFLMGLLGGVHCAGMCGGIVGAVSWRRGESMRRPAYHVAYNAGRIGSYTLAGTLAGLAGAGGLLLEQLLPVRTLLYVTASILLIVQGLYLAGIGRGNAYLERAGGRIWAYIQPRSRALLPVDTPGKALLLGTLWGFLPCGMVYSALAIALATADPVNGALTMLMFGLGTAPNLLAMGYAAGTLRRQLNKGSVRLAAGMLVIGFGVIGLTRVMDPAAELAPHTASAHVHASTGH